MNFRTIGQGLLKPKMSLPRKFLISRRNMACLIKLVCWLLYGPLYRKPNLEFYFKVVFLMEHALITEI